MKNMRPLRALVKYLAQLAGVWIVGLFLLILDVVGGIEKLVPGLDLPRGVYLGLFSVSFLVANAVLFVRQEIEKQSLREHIAELEALEADIRLAIQGKPKLGVAEGSIDEQGLPHKGTIEAALEFENAGYKPGELKLEIDRAESQLPFPFEIDSENDWGFNVPLHGIDGQERTQRYLIIPVIVTAQEPSRFARALNTIKRYEVVTRYCTKRIGGISEERSLVIRGDFHHTRRKTKSYLKKRGFDELAQEINHR